jgi:hypothetical protein
MYIIAPGGVDTANVVVPAIRIEPSVAPPYAIGIVSDPRVDALIAQLAALSQQIVAIETAVTEIETMLANRFNEMLDPKDRIALDRLRAWLGIA